MTSPAQAGQDAGENTSGYTGGMIALVPAGEHLPDLAVDGGLDPGELHLTLAYLGDDVTGWPQENRDAVLYQAQAAAQSVDGLVMARVFGHALFNPDGGPDGDREPCAVYLVGDSRVLDALQQTVAVGLAGKDGIPEQHPNFFPHLTAGQGITPDQLSYTGPVVFDRLRVALGDDVTDIPLAASDDNEPVVADSGPNPQYIDVRVMSRDPGDLAAFVQLCQTIARCCGYGASRDITVSVDGDGSADLRFDFGDSDISDVEPLDVDGDLRIGIGG